MPDLGGMFRQFGQDVAGALTAGPQARLKALEMKSQIEERQDNKLRRQAKDAEKLTHDNATKLVARLLGEGKEGTPEYQKALGESGMTAYQMESLRIKAIPKPRKPDEFLRELNMAQAMSQKAMGDLGALHENILKKKKDGEDTTADMEALTAKQDIYKDKMGRYIENFEYDMKHESYAGQVNSWQDQVLGKYNAEDLQNLDTFVQKACERLGGGIQKLKEENDPYLINKGIDLNKIPTGAECETLSWSMLAEKEISRDELIGIWNVKETNDLQVIAEDPDNTKRVKQLATALLTKRLAGEALGMSKSVDNYKGNIKIESLPKDVSTVIIEENGKQVVLPVTTTDDAAIAYYKRNGRNLGKYNSRAEAEEVSGSLSQYAEGIGKRKNVAKAKSRDKSGILQKRISESTIFKKQM